MLKKIIIITILIPFILYGVYNYVSPSYSWNQKLTIEIEMPDGEILSQYSIMQLDVDTGLPIAIIPNNSNLTYKLFGEAAFIEVTNGKYLFYSLDSARVWGYEAFYREYFSKSRYIPFARYFLESPQDQVAKYFSYKSGPTLIAITEVNDPSSAKWIASDSSELVETHTIESIFGIGFSIKKVTLEMTNEPITFGKIETVLPKSFFETLGNRHNQALKNSDSGYFKSFESKIRSSNFIRKIQ